MKKLWPKKSLGDCAKFLSGGTPSKSRPEFWEGEIPWASSGELTAPRLHDTSLHVTPEAVEAGSRMIPENSILAVVRGMSLAKEFRISLTTREMSFNQDLKALVSKPGIDPVFLFYSLYARREYIRDRATEAAHGTKKLDTEVLTGIALPMPHYDVQLKVAAVARNYDDLIENNRRRIALLEESARLLYREWFVRLRFPGHEHTRIVNGVPEGWDRAEIAELTSFLKRGVAPKYDDTADGLAINQKCIRDGRVNLELARHQSREFKEERQVRRGDVLINSTGEGTLGRVAQLKVEVPNCTVDTHVTIVRPNNRVSAHYFGLSLMEWEPQLSTMGKGSTNQTELSPAAIGGCEILVPSDLLQSQFDELVDDVYSQISNLTSQNQKLRTARDLLLPKLMSGEIEV